MADDPLPERPPPPLTWRDVADRVLAPVAGAPWRLLGGAALVVAVAVAAWWALRPPAPPPTELLLPMAGAGSTAGTDTASGPGGGATSTTAGATLVVHAAGAVVSPGVHRVPAGARVADLLAAAGGPSPEADLDRVNLAAPLTDGERVWFPRVGEEAPPAVTGGAAGAAGAGPATPVDLNRATAEELDSLPGIGPSIAAAILEHRERNGPFASVDELLDVPGIGPAKLEALRDLVTV